MTIADLLTAQSIEATRLLRDICERLNAARPMPDGTVLLEFGCEPELLDRLSAWGATVEDYEDDGCAEDCARDLPKRRDELAEIREVVSQALSDLMSGTAPAPLPCPFPVDRDEGRSSPSALLAA